MTTNPSRSHTNTHSSRSVLAALVIVAAFTLAIPAQAKRPTVVHGHGSHVTVEAGTYLPVQITTIEYARGPRAFCLADGTFYRLPMTRLVNGPYLLVNGHQWGMYARRFHVVISGWGSHNPNWGRTKPGGTINTSCTGLPRFATLADARRAFPIRNVHDIRSFGGIRAKADRKGPGAILTIRNPTRHNPLTFTVTQTFPGAAKSLQPRPRTVRIAQGASTTLRIPASCHNHAQTVQVRARYAYFTIDLHLWVR